MAYILDREERARLEAHPYAADYNWTDDEHDHTGLSDADSPQHSSTEGSAPLQRIHNETQRFST